VEKIFGMIEREKALLQIVLDNKSRILDRGFKRTLDENKRLIIELTQPANKGSEEYSRFA